MPNPELVIRGQRVVTGNSVAPASVHITRGYISSISIFEGIPATTTAGALEGKLKTTAGKLCVDVAFWGGVVPGNSSELSTLWDAGVVGFKCFLVHSGVDEFPNVTEKDLREAMPELARLGAMLIVHAELPE